MLGRRLGRIYGKLEDIASLLYLYRMEQEADDNRTLSQPLRRARTLVAEALLCVQQAIDEANRGAK